MNDIIIRTNNGKYTAGDTIYGAVYLRLLEPVEADTVSLSVSGVERCKWIETVSALGGEPICERRPSSRTSTDTGFSEAPAHDDSERSDIFFRDEVFNGEHILIKDDLRLSTFKRAIPLGCYAFPFKYTLKQGLPSSFKRSSTRDEVKNTTYEAEVIYTLTARLYRRYDGFDSCVCCCQEIKVWKDNFVGRNNSPLNKTAKAVVKFCCCFPKGEISLNLTLDKVAYTLGETINCKFHVQNKAKVNISQATINLMKTLNLTGRRSKDGKQTRETVEAFPENDLITVPLEMGESVEKTFSIPVALKHHGNSHISTTMGNVVKNRYHLDIVLEVPFDQDVSIFIPVEVFPYAVANWGAWTQPEWIKDTKVCEVNKPLAVSKQLLTSSNFNQVPLPLSGLCHDEL